MSFNASHASQFRRLSFAQALTACVAMATAFGTAGATGQRNASVRYVPSQAAILIVGPFGEGLAAEVRHLLRVNPDARLVIVASNGGMRAQAIEVAKMLNERKITTRIFGRCASACALLWASTERREMTEASSLGLHKSHLAGLLPQAIEKRIARANDNEDAAALRAAGFPTRLISARDATSADEVTWFSASELKRDGVQFTLLESRPNGPASGR